MLTLVLLIYLAIMVPLRIGFELNAVGFWYGLEVRTSWWAPLRVLQSFTSSRHVVPRVLPPPSPPPTQYSIDILFIVDLVINFRTGFTNALGAEEMHPRLSARQYLSGEPPPPQSIPPVSLPLTTSRQPHAHPCPGWFSLDFVSACSAEFMNDLGMFGNLQAAKLTKTTRTLKALKVLKLSKLFKISHFPLFEDFEDEMASHRTQVSSRHCPPPLVSLFLPPPPPPPPRTRFE